MNNNGRDTLDLDEKKTLPNKVNVQKGISNKDYQYQTDSNKSSSSNESSDSDT